MKKALIAFLFSQFFNSQEVIQLDRPDHVTVQNIQVLEVNTQEGYMLIKGSVPGSKNGFIKIAKAVKKA